MTQLHIAIAVMLGIVGLLALPGALGFRLRMIRLKSAELMLFLAMAGIGIIGYGDKFSPTNAPPARGSGALAASHGLLPSRNGSDAIAMSLPRSLPLITPDPGTGPFTNIAPFEVSNLCFTAIADTHTSLWAAVAWPPALSPTNDALDLYARGTLSLCDPWRLHGVLPLAPGSTNVVFELQKDALPTNGVDDSCFLSVGTQDDTDGDGLTDVEEVLVYGSDPSLMDSDLDGLLDGDEVMLGLDPVKSDSDGDGLSDGDEMGWISEHGAFLWYDGTGWPAKYACEPWGGGDGFTSPPFPLLSGPLLPAVPAYDAPLAWFFAYECGYVSFFATDYGVTPYPPSQLCQLNETAGNYGAMLVVPYWMYGGFSVGDTNSFMRSGYVASNGVHVVEYRNLKKDGTDDGITMEVIVPTNGSRTVLISYQDSDFLMDGDEAVVGVQNKRIDTANGYYNLTYDFSKFGPILPRTTWEYHLGYGTDPKSTDTDRDGLSDYFEICVALSDPLSPDGDVDGLTDVEEYYIGTNPKSTDSDGDSLPDGWEVTYNLNPLSPEGFDGCFGDVDNDGLANWQECIYGTNPCMSDTDMDGLIDSAEIALGTNPCSADPDGDGLADSAEIEIGTDPSNPDTDCDGLLDGAEVSLHTNPRQPDSDGDGMTDGWEHRYMSAGFDPLVNNATDINPDNDLDADPDGDGLTNGQECGWDTNPSGLDIDGNGVADGYDTDGDGINDGMELAQNSDPNDASDFGNPNSRTLVSFYFGDHSESHSEKYAFLLQPVPGSGRGNKPRSYRRVNSHYGECETNDFLISSGWLYEVRLSHVATNLAGVPDYDYTLEVVALNDACLLETNGLFGVSDAGDHFGANGKTAKLFVIEQVVMTNSVAIAEDAYAYITAEPQMPNLSARLYPTGLVGAVNMHLNIEYRRSPAAQSSRYPRGSSGHIMPASDEWRIMEDIGDDFRGGRAMLVGSYGEFACTNIFHVRGVNPNNAAAEEAIGDGLWYLKAIARRESGRQNGHDYCQFNEVGTLGTEWGDYRACPNFGRPNGWGIFMLDPPVNEESLWNWRTNVIQGIGHIYDVCIPAATQWINRQVQQQQQEEPTMPLSEQTFIIGGVEFREGTGRTPIDACAIQRYNGAPRWVIYWRNKTPTSAGAWCVSQSATNYVASVMEHVNESGN